MAAPRFFAPLELTPALVGQTLALPDAAAHHATRVVRLGAGDTLTLFTGAGGEYAATIADVGKRGATVRIEAFDPVERESPLAVTLAQGIAANDAMDHAIRKANGMNIPFGIDADHLGVARLEAKLQSVGADEFTEPVGTDAFWKSRVVVHPFVGEELSAKSHAFQEESPEPRPCGIEPRRQPCGPSSDDHCVVEIRCLHYSF